MLNGDQGAGASLGSAQSAPRLLQGVKQPMQRLEVTCPHPKARPGRFLQRCDQGSHHQCQL